MSFGRLTKDSFGRLIKDRVSIIFGVQYVTEDIQIVPDPRA